MPLPKPRPNETQNAFVSRCIEAETKASPGKDPKQVQAMCFTQWRNRNQAECTTPAAANLQESGDGFVELRDSIDFEGAEFVEAADGGQRVIRNLAMVGPTSKHGYGYPEQTLRTAVNAGLYENVQIFCNHSEKDGGRNIMEMAGVFVRPKMDGPRIRGDAVLLNDEYGDKVWNIAKLQKETRAVKGAGFSHVASGKMRREGGNAFVEEIRAVLSVDLVTTPATNTNMYEGVKEMEWKDVTADALRSNRPEVANAIYQEGAKSRDDEVKQLMEKSADLEKKVDEFQVKEAVSKRRETIEKMLSESTLPATAKTDVFRRSLEKVDCQDWEKTVKEMIDDRAAMVGGVRNMGNETNPNQQSGGDGDLKSVREAFGS